MIAHAKRLTLIALVPVALFLPAVVHAQNLGLSVGANFNELSDIDTGDREATFDNATGWHVHLWYDLPVGPVALRPGIRYMDAGEVLKGETDLGDLDEDATLSVIEVPVDVRFRFTMPLITPYVMVGPVLRFPTSSDDDGDRFKSFSLAGGAGLGVELGLGSLRLYPELKYTFGITRFTEDEYELGGITIEPDESQRLNAIMLSLGIGL